ncbi:MAG TPA: aromatic ring-hydroxylating dioxygenase subunit alpha [Candidatus Acidoferrales bacterium]|nr:aromatic ring-hydroxylating dioxygenase subunit alpha [Candidatus Acidoferrales bacterium]
MEPTLKEILASYNAAAVLQDAYTIPAPWYTDARIAQLELHNVFSRTWQTVGRTSQVEKPGQYVTATVAGEPIVAVRGSDGKLRAFYNVCRHHAMTVMNEPCGHAQHMRCPYHGWTYNLEGELRGMTEFEGVCNFDRAQNGLVPVRVEAWENFIFVNLDPHAAPLHDFLGALVGLAQPLNFGGLKFVERRSYIQQCNWKVYVDNFLDGGYHVPHMHKGLNSVLDYTNYTIENVDRCCVQSSPVAVDKSSEASAAATRKGDRAYYFWQYPNFMLNWYEGYLDTNLVIPLGIDRCEVIFDFYFGDTSEAQMPYIRESMGVSERVQQEDIVICDGVQRGLSSRAYQAGRLSVRREAGEHLFHRLLAADLNDTRAAAAR